MDFEEVQLCESVIKRDRRGRKVSSKRERERWLELYDQSGLTQSRFCEHHGINIHTFVNWLGQRRQSGGVQASRVTKSKFQEVVVSGFTGQGGGLEVVLPDGTLLKSTNAALVVQVIKELRG